MSNAGCERQPNDGELVERTLRGSMDAFDILVGLSINFFAICA